MSEDGTTEATRVVQVRRRHEEAAGVITLRLAAPDLEPLPAWEPGAHIDLMLGDGLVRQYSLSGDAQDQREWEIAILLEEQGRGGSRRVFDTLREGVSVPVRGPRNHFELRPAPRYRFVAGGIGITPIRAMVTQAERAGADWELLYGGRTARSMAFATELNSRFGERVRIRPQDEYGHLDLKGFLGAHQEGTLAYACGPEPLLHAFEEACDSWPSAALRTERFVPVDNGHLASRAFEVELALSGLRLEVPADKSALEVIQAAGVFVASSCAEGTCGSCEAGVLEGTPEHRDSVLTPEEQALGESMMICVSRCQGDRLVLEL